jgi:CDP-diacylglycerol--serine O-phosphatidyltransferase
MYHWGFHALADEFGVAVVFFFALCSASRLARFNISAENLKSFSGLPTPGAAAFVVAVVRADLHPSPSYLNVVIASVVMLGIGYLMVSRIEFFSIKEFKLSRVRLRSRVLLGLIIALTWYNFAIGFLLISAAYVASGPYLRVRPGLPKWWGGARLKDRLERNKIISLVK